jgi:multiple sugar transport system permease protein
LVGPSSFFLLILNVIYSFQVFDIIFVMTGGGPQNATSVLVTYAYDQGFVTRDQGYAAAIGMVLLVLMLIFTAVQWRVSRNRDLVE